MTSFAGLADPLEVGPLRIRNRVFLAPLSGITDRVFRKLAHDHGAGLVVSEMVASGELAKGRSDSQRRIAPAGEGLHVVQLAGREPAAMAQGARIAAGEGADLIDINMGCPAKKVTGGLCGSALMRDLDLALRLVDAVVEAADRVPVSVKMRLGWDETEIVAPELARRAEAAGVRMVTVHGRTRSQFYTGRADWSAIRQVKEAVRIPVVANGDVSDARGAAGALAASGADALMIGRAHYGRPWLAGEIAAAAAGRNATGIPGSDEARVQYVLSHYEAMLSLYGLGPGIRHARKHLGWYLDRMAPGVPSALRASLMTATDHRAVIDLLKVVLAGDFVPESSERDAA